VTQTSPAADTPARSRDRSAIPAARSPLVITIFVSASATMHDGAHTVAPATSAAGLGSPDLSSMKGSIADSIGSNKRAEDASAAFAIATWQSEPGECGSRIWMFQRRGQRWRDRRRH
jgi:hypothetical protein